MDENFETEISSDQNQSDSEMEVLEPSDFSKNVKFDVGKFDVCPGTEVLPVVREQRNNTCKARIFLVEDNQINTFVNTLTLNSMGHIVNCANSSKQALKFLCSNQYDLIFIDCHMPGMSGFEVTKLLRCIETRQSLLPTPVIAITAIADTKTKQQCFTVGMNDFVTKPINKDAFKTILDNWFYCFSSFEKFEVKDLDPEVWRHFFLCQTSNIENKYFIETLSHLFLIDTLKILSRLHSSLSVENYICMHEDIHRLIGACQHIGALRMHLVCTDLKKTVFDGALESSTQLLQRLDYEFLRVQRSLARFKANGF